MLPVMLPVRVSVGTLGHWVWEALESRMRRELGGRRGGLVWGLVKGGAKAKHYLRHGKVWELERNPWVSFLHQHWD